MTRHDLGASWNTGHGRHHGAWPPVAITRSELLTNQTCARCQHPIPAGHCAITFVGAGHTARYHPTCAKTLGITPTS